MKRAILAIFVIIFLPSFILGQGEITVKGTVFDQDNVPLPSANILIKSLNIGAATDVNGHYSFIVPGDKAKGQEVILLARYVGYKEQQIAITLSGKEIVQDFYLVEDIFQSDEVVVTGIASKTSKGIAEVSVSRINAANLIEANNYQSLSQLVGGKISGVQLYNSSGNIGGGFSFYVRGGGGLNGNEQPMIYIDGVRVDNSELGGFGAGGQRVSAISSLNPDDIANIEVLKGPAGASTYGANGSNGVVLITTKSGKLLAGVKGQAISVDYKYTYGTNNQSYKYKTSNFISADDANKIFVTGYKRQHTLNLSGGSNFLRYYASFDTRFDGGIMPNNWADRKSARINLTAYPHKKLSIKINSNFVYNNVSRPQNDNNILGFLGNTLLFQKSYQFTDSLAILALTDITKIEQFIGGAQFTYMPIAHLEINAGIGIDNSNSREDRTFPSNFYYSGRTDGERDIYNRENRQFTYDFNARYNYSPLVDLQITSIVGSQLFNKVLRTNFLATQTFATELITDIGAGSIAADYGEGFLNSRDAGIYTTHSLSYQNKYFLTLGVREDFASAIGADAPSIIYPSASFAVRLDRFGIIPSGINLLKLRAAFGESGQLPDPQDPIAFLWEATTGGYGAGATLDRIGNTTIKPERVKEIEVGIDAEFLNIFSLEFTYYRQNATNSIIGKNNAPSTGLTASPVPYNVGGMKNWGFESLLQANPIRTHDYTLEMSLIWNYQKNEVTDLGGAQPIYDGFSTNVIKEGLPKHEFYLPVVKGAKFKADGTYNGVDVTADRVALGNYYPNHSGSFTVNFRFLKDFNFYALVDWALKRKMYNNTERFAVRFGNNPTYNNYQAQLGLTTNDPDVTRLTPGTQEYINVANKYAKMNGNYSANFIEDADFIKLREISLSYSLKNLLGSFLSNSNVKDLTIGISARNVWTSTPYSGAGVELNHNGSRSLTRGSDFLTNQPAREYNFWLRAAL